MPGGDIADTTLGTHKQSHHDPCYHITAQNPESTSPDIASEGGDTKIFSIMCKPVHLIFFYKTSLVYSDKPKSFTFPSRWIWGS